MISRACGNPDNKEVCYIKGLHCTKNSYTIVCPPVRDNRQALASGLSYVQVDKHGITIFIPPTSV